MQVVLHFLTLRHGVEERVGAVLRMGRHEPDEEVSGDVVDVPQQLREEFLFAEVVAVGVDVLAEEHDLLVAVRHELSCIVHDVLVLPAPLSAPDMGHDTERAEVVAAVGDGQERLEGVVAAGFQTLGDIVVVLGDVEDPLSGAEDVPEELRDLVLDMGAEDEVHVREMAFQPFCDVFLLDHAAAECDDQVRVRLLELLETADVAVNALLRMLSHRAGIEEDEVRFRRIVRELIAHLLEEAVDALPVRHIALAPVGVGEGFGRHIAEAVLQEPFHFRHVFKLPVQRFSRDCQTGHQLS